MHPSAHKEEWRSERTFLRGFKDLRRPYVALQSEQLKTEVTPVTDAGFYFGKVHMDGDSGCATRPDGPVSKKLMILPTQIAKKPNYWRLGFRRSVGNESTAFLAWRAGSTSKVWWSL